MLHKPGGAHEARSSKSDETRKGKGGEALFSFARHWQFETWRLALWVGFVPVRWEIGIEIDAATRTAGIGLGPFYVGLGVIA